MFKNKTKHGKNNLCGGKLYALRTGAKLSQRQVAEKLQIIGVDVDKNAVQRIESGQRFVTDIELKALAEVFKVSADDLIL